MTERHAFLNLAEAFIANPVLPGSSKGAVERLEDAIALADLDLTSEEDARALVAYIDEKGLPVPPDFIDTYKRLSESSKATYEAKLNQARAAEAVTAAANVLAEYADNITRGVSPDDPAMKAKAAEATATLSGLAAGKGKTLDPLPSFLARKYEEDDARRPGELIGLPLRRFHFLAERMDGIQPGFYIAAAETNIGKTAFLANLFLDALEANATLPGLYVSLDDPKSVIVDRFTTILARLAIERAPGEAEDAYARGLAGVSINALKRNLDGSPRLKDAKRAAADRLTAWASAGRLDIRDITELATGDALERHIRGMARGGRKPFVVIDALFNLDTGSNAGNLREENIERAQFLKKLSDDLEIPIWTTAEIRKASGAQTVKPRQLYSPPTTDDIMESSKYAYNANAVFMLYPETWDDFRESEAPRLVIDVQKNKLSDFKKPIFATFTKRAAFMELDPNYKPAGKKEKAESTNKPGAGANVHKEDLL